jgi:hypothetical protein
MQTGPFAPSRLRADAGRVRDHPRPPGFVTRDRIDTNVLSEFAKPETQVLHWLQPGPPPASVFRS